MIQQLVTVQLELEFMFLNNVTADSILISGSQSTTSDVFLKRQCSFARQY